MLLDNVFRPFIKAPYLRHSPRRSATNPRPAPHRPLVHTDHLTPVHQRTAVLLSRGPDDSCRHRPEPIPSTPPTANWKTNSRSAIVPFTQMPATSNWHPSPAAVGLVIRQTRIRPSSAAPAGLDAPALARLPRSKFLDGNHLAASGTSARELRSTWAIKLPQASPSLVLGQEHNDGHRRVAVRGRPHSGTRLMERGLCHGHRPSHRWQTSNTALGLLREYRGPAWRLLRPAQHGNVRVSCWANGDPKGR